MAYITKRKKFMFIFELILAMLFFIMLCVAVEKKVVPSLIAISEIEAKRIANGVIDTAVRVSVTNMNLCTEDFFVTAQDGKQISANTMLINKLCTEVSSNVNEGTTVFEERKIAIALGSLSGFDILSNSGPKISFRIRQMGESNVNYETSFEAAGINQTNYKVWITVDLLVKLINPLRSEVITAERKVMLIDTIIEGPVPERFFNME